MAERSGSSNRRRQRPAAQERAAANTLLGDAFAEVDPAHNPPTDAVDLPPDPSTKRRYKYNSSLPKTKSWQNSVPYLVMILMMMYICHLRSMLTSSAPPPVPRRPPAVDRETIEMAEFAYENQKGERNENAPISAKFAKFGANWPCFYGETAVGDLNTWKYKWAKYKDGWKYVCGLSYITEPCVVYSLGSSGNMAFEKNLLEKGENTLIDIYKTEMTYTQLSV